MRWEIVAAILLTVVQAPLASAECGADHECVETCVERTMCAVTERTYNGGCENASGSTWRGVEVQAWAAEWPGPFTAGAGETCYTGPSGSNASEHGFVAWYDNYGLYDDPNLYVAWLECHNMWCPSDCYVVVSYYVFPIGRGVVHDCPSGAYPPYVLLP